MKRFWRKRPLRCLGVLLCYNDGDLLPESIAYLREQKHDIVLWDHGSTDTTPSVVENVRAELVEAKRIPREFDFYQLYQEMSWHLLAHYVGKYDWISWPDQDEFLEGPNRSRSYYDALREVADSEFDWIQFNNFNYWLTREDDPQTARVQDRIKRYSLFPDCAPRIRSWRASATNIREFNHNEPLGKRYPTQFNLRHYPMRSEAQLMARLQRDRANLRRGDANFHYDNMRQWSDRLRIDPSALHLDDGTSELNPEPIFNWRDIYGYANSRRSS